MPQLLANPISVAQLTDASKIGLVNWHKGAEMSIPKTLAVRSLYHEYKAPELNEEHSSMSESGFSSVTGDGEDYKLVADIQGDTITMTQVKRTVRRKITEDLIEFNKYPKLASLLRQTGTKLWRGYALDLTHKFTFAFDTSYTDRDGRTVSVLGGDAAALCADSRTLNSGDTYDNKSTARISEAAIEDGYDLGNAMVDHKGEMAVPEFTAVITGVHASTRNTAMKLTSVRQMKQVGTDLNDLSVYSGQLRHVVLPYLDTTAAGARNSAKSRYWFLMDETLAKQEEHLKASVRTMPLPEAPSVDPNNNTIQFKGKMRYDIGHLDSHFIVGFAAV